MHINYKKILDLLDEESIPGARSGRASHLTRSPTVNV